MKPDGTGCNSYTGSGPYLTWTHSDQIRSLRALRLHGYYGYTDLKCSCFASTSTTSTITNTVVAGSRPRLRVDLRVYRISTNSRPVYYFFNLVLTRPYDRGRSCIRGRSFILSTQFDPGPLFLAAQFYPRSSIFFYTV